MSEIISIDKAIPHNLDAEQTVLGSLLLDNTFIDQISNILKPKDFFYLANEEIYDVIIYLYRAYGNIDYVSVANELEKREKLDAVGGNKYLIELTQNIATTRTVMTHVRIVEEKSILRAIINAGNEIVAKGTKANDEIQEILDFAESKIFAINQSRRSNDFSPIKDVLFNVFDQLEAKAIAKDKITGIDTGFRGLNNITGGLQKSDLILIAARPAMGKTAFALNIAISAAKASKSVALFSLEMSKEQYIQRLIGSEGLIELSKLRNGQLDEDEWDRITTVMQSMTQYKVFVDDTAAITYFDLSSKCRRLKAERGLDLIIIDYLQLMNYSGRSENRQQEISSISRGLKKLAREMDCPVVALSQLSRAVEQRPDHRPMLSDLRESGAIEQDADMVMMLYRDEYYKKEESEKKGIAEIIIAKHRNGSVGTVELSFVDKYTKFTDLPSVNYEG